MRYKVKAHSKQEYERADALAREGSRVVVSNPRRRTLSIDQASTALLEALRTTGAEVKPERRYDLDTSP